MLTFHSDHSTLSMNKRQLNLHGMTPYHDIWQRRIDIISVLKPLMYL